ncbi:MAG TPA: FAD-dependent oxidoreductase, partial [Roseiarcus sp.]
MLTPDELAAIPLFSTLSPIALADVARAAADIHLNTGEFAAYEGEPPALFVVLEGTFEVIKLVDGVERKLGLRTRGKLFGEIPLVFGTQFQAGFRAGEPSRVLKLEAQPYYTAAASSPELARTMDELAKDRIGGLQKLAAEPRNAQVTLLRNRWDSACLDLRRFLERNQISFNWLTPDDPNLAELWSGPPPADADCPALRLPDGATLIRPQPREFAARLGLQTTPRFTDYDTVIIGGGPAGLAAAVYGASEGLRTIVVEREAPGGQAETSSRIENYLGFPSGISGSELASRAHRQAKRLGAEIIVARRIVRIDPHARSIDLDNEETLHARTVIVASGVSWRRL